jgi:hypothetical protein
LDFLLFGRKLVHVEFLTVRQLKSIGWSARRR